MKIEIKPQKAIVEFHIEPDITFTMTMTRNPVIDNRLNCGAGWNILIERNGESLRQPFNNSKMNREELPDPKNVLDCILGDTFGFINEPDFESFCSTFGYDVYDDYGRRNKNAYRIFRTCEEIATKMQLLFTIDELEKIDEEIRNS